MVFLQQSCNANQYTREGYSPFKAGARVRLLYALPRCAIFEDREPRQLSNPILLLRVAYPLKRPNSA